MGWGWVGWWERRPEGKGRVRGGKVRRERDMEAEDVRAGWCGKKVEREGLGGVGGGGRGKGRYDRQV